MASKGEYSKILENWRGHQKWAKLGALVRLVFSSGNIIFLAIGRGSPSASIDPFIG